MRRRSFASEERLCYHRRVLDSVDLASLVEIVRQRLGASSLEVSERIQSLWSGYGAIYRCSVEGASEVPGGSVVVKHVKPPSELNHPRGWASSQSHERKLRSYRVEQKFYESYAPLSDQDSRVPNSHFLEENVGEWLFALEDLDASGFSVRRHSLGEAQLRSCVRWLAEFHALHLGTKPEGLWEVGTYWHLATRPDELAVMADDRLRDVASAIDRRLSSARFQTLVHGDAKVANFCFPDDLSKERRIAVVDFQYVGGGCGMKDLAYFFSSCLDEGECEKHAERWLDEYFLFLRAALERRGKGEDVEEVEREWRGLYALAWADFVRFLLGWAPEHFKLHGYSRRMTERALREL